jgi:hypothetical protein
MNEIPALGRDSLTPFKTSLPPVTKREQRGLASSAILDLVAPAHVKVGRKDKSNRRNATFMGCDVSGVDLRLADPQ